MEGLFATHPHPPRDPEGGQLKYELIFIHPSL